MSTFDRWVFGIAVPLLVVLVVVNVVAFPQWLSNRNAQANAAATAPALRATAAPTSSAAPATPLTPLPVVRPTDGPLRVLFAGDSITVGAFSLTQDKNFRSLMTAELSKGGEVDAKRIGDSGLTTSQVFAELPDAGDGFNVAIVELGTNDVHGTEVTKFASDYGSFLDTVRAQSPDATMLCVGPWEDRSLPKTVAMNRIVEQACAGHAGRFVDVLDLYSQESNRGPEGTVRESDGAILDDFHPNDAGHAAIAETILAQLAY